MEFYIDPYNVLLWVHVLLFGYWLGSDLGVYYCDSQLTREDLDLAERLRVREIRLKLDLVPRFCLIILLALGLTMATRYGSPITGAWSRSCSHCMMTHTAAASSFLRIVVKRSRSISMVVTLHPQSVTWRTPC